MGSKLYQFWRLDASHSFTSLFRKEMVNLIALLSTYYFRGGIGGEIGGGHVGLHEIVKCRLGIPWKLLVPVVK